MIVSPSITGWWFGTFLFFHSVGNVIIPTDFDSIIFRMGRWLNHQPVIDTPKTTVIDPTDTPIVIDSAKTVKNVHNAINSTDSTVVLPLIPKFPESMVISGS